MSNDYLKDVEESSEKLRKMQEKARLNQQLQQQQEEDDDEEDDEDDEDDEGYGDDFDFDENDLDEGDKNKIISFITNLLKKTGVKTLIASGSVAGSIGLIATLFIGMYRIHYDGEFEFKGVGGEYQTLSFKNMNFTLFDDDGNVQLAGMTKENKLSKTYYTMYSDNSYYVVVEDSDKYKNLNDAYKRENLLTAKELREQYPDIKDTEGREKMFQLNPDVLYSLDRYLHKNEFLYPQQFIKPVYYNENKDDFSLKQLVDKEGTLVAKSQLFNADGSNKMDDKNKPKKEAGVWDYGMASILRYKEYKVKERDIKTLSGAKLKYKGYANPSNPSENVSADKEVTETKVDKKTASFIPEGVSFDETSAEKDAGRVEYAIDTAVTPGGTIESKVAQKWQEKEGSRSSNTYVHKLEETVTEEVEVTGDDGVKRTELKTLIYKYEIEYTYESYTEEYVPYYEGDLDTSGITGSKYFRDYIKHYSNYIPVDVPDNLDFSVLDTDEIKELLYDDDPANINSGAGVTNGSGATKEEFNKAIFMGDSITVGMSASSVVPDSRVFAESGYTVSKGTDKFADKIIQQKPPVVVISYGTNDAGYENPDKFIKDYKDLITKLKDGIPGVKIYLNKIFPGNSSLAKTNTEKTILKNIPAHNTALEKIASESGVTLIDCTKITNLNSYYQDAFHFKSSFYKEWLSEMEKQIVSNTQSDANLPGETFKAEFTAYKSGDGGYDVDASGNKLDYTKNTCAGPIKSKYPNSKLSLGSKVVIQGTGTDKDGMTCTITDTGVPLDKDGTYHIDILVKDEATARAFGRRNGTIKILSSSSSSSRSIDSDLDTTSSVANSNARTTVGSKKVGDHPLSEVLSIGEWKDTDKGQAGLKWFEYAKTYGEKYGVDPYIICAVIASESGGDPNLDGSYVGLMQISKKYIGKSYTAYNHIDGKNETVTFERDKRTDPAHNIEIGTMMLAKNFEESNFNVFLSIQGHNFGIYGSKFVILYYLSNGTLEGIPSSNATNKEQEAQFREYSETNDTGWITAVFEGDLAEEKANQNGHGLYDPNDGVHDACVWYGSLRPGQAYYLRETMRYYGGDGAPWMMKSDGTVVTADGGNASNMGGSTGMSANSAFNSYLASNWDKFTELKDKLFSWAKDLDEKEKLARNEKKYTVNMTDTDVDIVLNMMFALNQGNYLSKYDYMGESEWKAMYNQLLSSPTGKTWDDKWIGFTCEEIFGKSLDDLGTIVSDSAGVNPTISRHYGVWINRITEDTENLPQHNEMNFGVDISLPSDTEILALDDGEVISAVTKGDDLGRYGNFVTIKYNSNARVTVANLKSVDKKMKKGAKVTKGQVIGTSGGNCKSYKDGDLHLELIYKNEFTNPEWIITRDMTGFEDPIAGNNGIGGAVCNNPGPGVGNGFVETALQQVGKPYVWGAKGPDSFDCSGLVLYSMKENGISFKMDSTYDRTSANMRKAVPRINYEDLQPGDLIFRHGDWNEYSASTTIDSNVKHIMIYVGNGAVVHARDEEHGVQKTTLKKQDNYSYGRYSGTSGGSTSSTSSSIGCQTSNDILKDDGTYNWPVPSATRVSSPFGYRIHPVLGTKKMHDGIDVPAPTGTDVIATKSGTVTFSGLQGSYGNLVIIDHGNGLTTRYAHNSALLVKKNDTVTQGQVIAKVGSTGRSTGPHLHFEVRVNGVAKNPLDYVKP